MSGTPSSLLAGFSIEMTAKDVSALEEAAPLLPPETKIPVAFLPGETMEQRVFAARRIRELGFIPIPHISARRITSLLELEQFLAALQSQAQIDHAFVVAGDPPKPMGPFDDALALIRTGLLARYGVRRVGISGYPEGHPEIGNDKLWRAKRDKTEALLQEGHDFAIVTQFGFDAKPLLRWIEQLRAEGITALVRAGVPGPATVGTLLKFAARCGVGASTRVLTRYGMSLGKLFATAGPDRLLTDIAAGLDPVRHGAVLIHLYPFGGLRRTAEWAAHFSDTNAS
jgi:methylenetetrahydrofolate reductase (NADPH)